MKIILLTAGGNTATYMYNGINPSYHISSVVVEERFSRVKFIKKRIKRLGLIKVIGQLLFQGIVPRLLGRLSSQRIQEIMSLNNLNATPIPEQKIHKVTSVNAKQCLDYLTVEKPDFIIVNGTRIISKKTLQRLDAVVVNTHLGITPRYRGVHGAYWALVNDDEENCGVSVHLVDSGIDTGGVLYQNNIYPTAKDNFVTYPYLQIAEGILLMKKTLSDFSKAKLSEVQPKTKDSNLWHHPTLWYYLKMRILKQIK